MKIKIDQYSVPSFTSTLIAWEQTNERREMAILPNFVFFPISDFFLLSVECLQQQEKIAFAMQWPIIKAKNGKILR